MVSTNNKTSVHVSNQLPAFVRDDNPLFVSFLEAYYEYMEQNNKTIYHIRNLPKYIDIDTTVEEFSEKLYSEFLQFFPKDNLADKTKVLKNVKDFYRSRGTEKSYKFLLRLLTGQEAELYYPKNDILKASDGKWFIEKSLRVSDVRRDNVSNSSLSTLSNFEKKRIYGVSSNAYATVERAEAYYELGSYISEIFTSSVHGTFTNGEQIYTTYYDTDLSANATLTANIFSGIVNSITVTSGGLNYNIGDAVVFNSLDSGSGAAAVVSSISTGNVSSVFITYSGAGFRANDLLLISGGGGSGANAYVASVNSSGQYHSNSFTLSTTLLSLYSNTVIANIASNLINSLSNSTMTYGNCGPATLITIVTPGSNYTSVPTLDIVANSRIKALGILGRMEVNAGGLGYNVGEQLVFTNVPGGYGFSAAANVTNVAANGMIRTVGFYSVSGHYSGGAGFSQGLLPTVSVTTNTGTSANITVTSILGDGEQLTSTTGDIGRVQSITITSGGSNYRLSPNVDLSGSGDGTARAICSVVQGTYSYPGRYLNDDGFISAYNFLQDRDYYQNYSYVVKVKENFTRYFKQISDLLHPSGMKIFAENLLDDFDITKFNGLSMANSEYSQKEYYSTYTRNLIGNNYLYSAITTPNASFSVANTGTLYIKVSPYTLMTNGANSTILQIGNSNSSSIFTVLYSNSGNSQSGTGNYFRILGKNSLGAIFFDMKTNEVTVPIVNVSNEYYELLASWNLSNGSNVNTATHLYLNNVDCKILTCNTSTNSNINFYTANTFTIGANGTGSLFFSGNIANIYLSYQYTNFSNVNNRTLFTETSYPYANNANNLLIVPFFTQINT